MKSSPWMASGTPPNDHIHPPRAEADVGWILSFIDSDDLIVSDGIAGDAGTLDNERPGTPWGVQRVQFADGTTWTQTQMVSTSPSSSVPLTDAVPRPACRPGARTLGRGRRGG